MTVQMQSVPSFASIISAVSIVFYCTGFFRVQLELNDQNMRISAPERVAASSKPLSNDQNMKLIKDAVGKLAFCSLGSILVWNNSCFQVITLGNNESRIEQMLNT